MNFDLLKKACLEVMEKAEYVVVTTIDMRDRLCSRAMFNMRCVSQYPQLQSFFHTQNDSLLVYLSTNTSSDKARQLHRNPQISIHYCEPDGINDVMLGGEVTMTQDNIIRNALWQDGWEIYFPAGPEDPDYTVIILKPSRCRGWINNKSFDIDLDSLEQT